MPTASPGVALRSIYADELKDYLHSHRESDYLLVDVREPMEYEIGHIPGAKPIPLSRFEQRLNELDTDRELLLYCASGTRSRVAAGIVAASGLRPAAIYNVVGGFYAWDGRALENLPRVKTFDQISGLTEVLTAAMDLEKGAWRFYSALLERYSNVPFAAAAATLVKLEHQHARMVHQMLCRHADDDRPEDFERRFAALSGDILEGGEPLETALSRAESLDLQPCLTFADLALDIETHAYELYRVLSDQDRSAEEKALFLTLAEQEKGHIRLITGKLEQCMQV